MKTEPIQFRTDEENKRELETMANSHGLSVSAYLRMLIKRDYQTYRNVKLVPAINVTDVKPEQIAE